MGTNKRVNFRRTVSTSVLGLAISCATSLPLMPAWCAGESADQVTPATTALPTPQTPLTPQMPSTSAPVLPPPADPAAKPQMRMDATETKALELLMADKDLEARKVLTAAIAVAPNSAAAADYSYFLALIENQAADYKAAIKHLESALQSLSGRADFDTRRKVLLLKRIGNCYYGMRSLDDALTYYGRALSLARELPPTDPVVQELLEGSMACQLMQKRYEEAEKNALKLVDVTAARAGASNKLGDLGAHFWANLELIDLYRREGKDQERLALRAKMVTMLERLQRLRESAEKAHALPPMDELKRAFLSEYVLENRPATIAEYLWLSGEFKMRSLPLITWHPADGKARAAILCIHGLGLDNRAFTHFAGEMVKRGFMVLAMDVRGFGSWLTIPGEEEVQFKTALQDVGAMVNMIKERNKGLPVFVLGESMGGAIALRAGSQLGNSVDGIISSVPSAEQFQQRVMSLTVAYHFLQDKDRPFSIGQMVTERATSRDELRRSWKFDPKAKMKMTPMELTKFAVFMRSTEHHCPDIKTTPVFIVQGLKDRLVKPQGTYAMFDAVGSEDKTMLIVGTAEHLIFETDKQTESILTSLTAWLDSHIPAAQAAQPAPAPQ